MRQAKKRHIIWSNLNLDLDDWRDDLKEEYPDLNEDELYEKMYEANDEYLLYERENLNIELDHAILVIADLGLWNGRHLGYKEIRSGNIKDCLYSDVDMIEWFIDENGDLRANAIHHDGINHYLYREYRDDDTDKIDHLLDKIYKGKVSKKDIDNVTRPIGPVIAKVYGLELKDERKQYELQR